MAVESDKENNRPTKPRYGCPVMGAISCQAANSIRRLWLLSANWARSISPSAPPLTLRHPSSNSSSRDGFCKYSQTHLCSRSFSDSTSSYTSWPGYGPSSTNWSRSFSPPLPILSLFPSSLFSFLSPFRIPFFLVSSVSPFGDVLPSPPHFLCRLNQLHWCHNPTCRIQFIKPISILCEIMRLSCKSLNLIF